MWCCANRRSCFAKGRNCSLPWRQDWNDNRIGINSTCTDIWTLWRSIFVTPWKVVEFDYQTGVAHQTPMSGTCRSWSVHPSLSASFRQHNHMNWSSWSSSSSSARYSYDEVFALLMNKGTPEYYWRHRGTIYYNFSSFPPQNLCHSLRRSHPKADCPSLTSRSS